MRSSASLEWRCTDSLSLREFLGLELRQRVPDHWLSKTRGRLPLEVHEAVFAWVLERLDAEWAWHASAQAHYGI